MQDASRHEPSGVYTVARTFHRTSALELDAHLDRLEESAHLLGIPLKLDRAALRRTLRQLIDETGYPESRFRITIPAARPDHIYFAIEPLHEVPPELRKHGVRVQTFPGHRRNPRAKNTDWMKERALLQQQMTDGTYEGLLVSPDGFILEGLGSNFYGILGSELHTASNGVLRGISRRIVLEVAPQVLPVCTEPVALDAVPQLQEAFLTSSSRGVVPIVMIDDHRVGDGRPGPLTREIEARYNAWAEAHLEPIWPGDSNNKQTLTE